MKPHVLITGSGGFLGMPLTKELRAAGYQVTALSHTDGDICSVDLTRLRPEYLVHLAGNNFVPLSWVKPQEIYRTNTLGTLHALETCRQLQIPFLLNSCYVYGKPDRNPVNEAQPVRAHNPYVLSKVAAEQLAMFYAEHHQVPVTIIRPFNSYGPGQAANFVIPHILSQLLDPGCEAVEVMSLKPRRDFLYITDFVDAVFRLIDRGKTGIYNLGTGVSHSVGAVAECAMEVLGIRKPLRDAENHANVAEEVRADPAAVCKAVDWKPLVPLPEGLMLVANHLRAGM